jgi:metal-responsive CopG/Arc/MetJ family transcriptional regulator
MESSMTAAAKIAISLPQDVLASVEEACRGAGQSRSSFILRAVQAYLEASEAQAEAAAYALGYERFPETPEEIAEIDRMGAAVLALEPWD